MRTFILAAAMGATALTGGVALAAQAQTAPAPAAATAPPPAGPVRGMMRADTNGDGVVTKAEAVAFATKRFDRMDTNRDGKLDQTELSARGPRGGHHGGRRMGGGNMPPPPPPADDQ